MRFYHFREFADMVFFVRFQFFPEFHAFRAFSGIGFVIFFYPLQTFAFFKQLCHQIVGVVAQHGVES